MKQMKTRYHVTQRRDGSWQGKKEGSKKPSVTGSTQKEVMDETVNVAKSKGDSQVFIHGKNGRIRDERTYGKDPYPPKG